MKCNDAKYDLMTLTKNSELTILLKEHLDRCRKCYAYYEDINNLFEDIGSDNLFSLSESEAEKMINDINHKLDKKKPEPTPFYRYLSMAAALILVLGVTYIARQTGEFDRDKQTTYSNIDSIDSNEDRANNLISDNELYNLYFDQINQENSDTDELWNYLSNEDFEYLEDNFDVKDLL